MGLLLGVAVVLQMSLLPALRLFGVVPNVLLVVTVLVALSVATSEALVAAAAAGLVVDLASGMNFGLWMGMLMLSTLAGGLVHRAGIELHGGLVAAGLVILGTLLMTGAIWSTLVTAGVDWPIPASFGGRLMMELLLNLMLTMALQTPVRWALSLGGGRPEFGG